MSRAQIRSSTALVFLSLLAGCATAGSAATDPARNSGSRSTTTGGMDGSEITVGLRVDLDEGEGDDAHVHIVAVTTDVDGHESTSEVGDYPGHAVEEESDEEHVTIDDEIHHVRQVIWTERVGDVIEVRRRVLGASPSEYEVIDRIEVEPANE